VELAGRLKFPAFTPARWLAEVSRAIPRLHRQLRNRTWLGHRLSGRLAWQGRRKVDARRAQPQAVGDVRERTTACFTTRCRWNTSTCATGTRAIWNGRKRSGYGGTRIPSSSTSTPSFCRAFAAPRRASAQANSRPNHLRKRVETYFDPLPFHYVPLEEQATDTAKYPLNAITQRPMAMYHSWDSQNAWLRQIHTHNYLFVNTKTAAAEGITDGGWMWVESQWGKVRCMCRYSERWNPARCGPGTPSANRPAPGI
jgi:anaerobic selenocysteine-containing dehydrogenase